MSVVYMTSFDNNFDDARFNLPTYHLSCKHIESDECHEAVPYLRFIYEHYDGLEGKIFFIYLLKNNTNLFNFHRMHIINYILFCTNFFSNTHLIHDKNICFHNKNYASHKKIPK